MNEETQRSEIEPSGAQEDLTQAMDPITTFLEAMATAVGVETVFGEPVVAEGKVIIPVAETSIGGGVGFGHGPVQGQEEGRPVHMGWGGGSGGGANTRPVAAIIVTAEGVRVQPIIDVSKVALTGIASSAALWRGLATFIKAMGKRR